MNKKINKTYSIKKAELDSKWHLIDADGKVLGRIATEIVALLVGKNKVNYTPNLNCGDYVIVINSKKVVVTGNKEEDMYFYRHSGVVGNLKKANISTLRKSNPNRIIYEAVKGMLPKNKLRKVRLSNLRIFEGSEHPHTAQVTSNGGK